MELRIATNLDFTPRGKRVARRVRTSRGTQLRWYVGGRLYVRGASEAMTPEWLANEGAANHRPQPWESFQ